MSSNKDLSLVPNALEDAIVLDERFESMSDDEKTTRSIEWVRHFAKKSLENCLNIGYWLWQIKQNSEKVAVLSNYRKAGFNERTARNYISIYKAFRELDSKKALKAFYNIEQSKLYGLAKLSKANLNQLAKEPKLIETIETQTAVEFKQQLLPGLIDGNVEELSKLQHNYNHTLKELEIVQNEVVQQKKAIREQQQQIDENVPDLVSKIKVKAWAHSQAASAEIASLTSTIKSITTGRHTQEFEAQAAEHKGAVAIEVANAARLMLANASALMNLVNLSLPVDIVMV